MYAYVSWNSLKQFKKDFVTSTEIPALPWKHILLRAKFRKILSILSFKHTNNHFSSHAMN